MAKSSRKWHKCQRKPENPVETGRLHLTNPRERLKVKDGACLRTRINKGDFRILPRPERLAGRLGKATRTNDPK
jgi:hypothetical protein